MGVDRRNFLKALGLTGVALGTGEKLVAGSIQEEDPKEFYGILYDSNWCGGCQGCEIACAEAHGLKEPDIEDIPEAGKIRKTDETRRTIVNAYNTSKGEYYCKTQCMQCAQPACASACLTRAMYKTRDGSVIWREEKCMGCRYCMISCPFDAPKFEYHSANPKIQKCDMCFDRVKEGKLPACVEMCPAEAIKFGTRRELIAEARNRIAEFPDMYHDVIYGEYEAGGTGWLYLSAVPFEEIGLNTRVQKKPYPELARGFLYSVPSVFVLAPALLLGIHSATKNHANQEENEQ
jgi:Fe-S-cluster-containing dehydrogenase component